MRPHNIETKDHCGSLKHLASRKVSELCVVYGKHDLLEGTVNYKYFDSFLLCQLEFNSVCARAGMEVHSEEEEEGRTAMWGCLEGVRAGWLEGYSQVPA